MGSVARGLSCSAKQEPATSFCWMLPPFLVLRFFQPPVPIGSACFSSVLHWCSWWLCNAHRAGGLAWFAQSPVGLRQSPLDFTIEPGSSMRQVARQIVDSGIDVEPFLLVHPVAPDAPDVWAATRSVRCHAAPVIDKLSRGDTTQGDVALIEGWSFRQFRAALDRLTISRHDSAGLSDIARTHQTRRGAENCSSPIPTCSTRQSSDLDVLRRAYAITNRWSAAGMGEAGRGTTTYKDPYEA